jgi:hypothetical protein
MPPVGFETTISAGERLQTYALDSVATGTGSVHECRITNEHFSNYIVQYLPPICIFNCKFVNNE